MTTFITGSTGYIGSYVINELAAKRGARVGLLVRGKSHDDARKKLWRAMQLHINAEQFHSLLDRVDFYLGDLTAPNLGMSDEDYRRAVRQSSSILHIAASLNRKSEKACLNTNLRGTLAVINLARAVQQDHGLRRYSHVSTVAVAGHRDRETVHEDAAIEWDRSDYDPYARTKKFCEHMARELLPDVRKTFFRPSIVMGDSRIAPTTQFDMVRAFCVLADLPVVPMRGDTRLDIVNADFVGYAIATLHAKDQPDYEIYHLSSGTGSQTAGEIARAINVEIGRRSPRFTPALSNSFSRLIDGMNALPGRSIATQVGALMKVFWPYITYDTVFDNHRVVSELGRTPAKFTDYGADLYQWSKSHAFRYPYVDMPSPSPRAEPRMEARP